MIFDASTLPAGELSVDLCVVGSGAGGAMVAMVAAEAGLRVLVLEAGALVTPDEMNQREEWMMPQLYWDGGGRTTVDRQVHIHQGKGVGGSTLHNLNLCKRIDPTILAAWRKDRGLAHLPADRWDALYREVESLLQVSEVPADLRNPSNRLLQSGCERLGWKWAALHHNRSGCVGSGFCALGCAFDAKNNALKVLMPRAWKAGAQVLTRCQAIAVDHDGERVLGVTARALQGPGDQPGAKFHIKAREVCLSASATGTAALLLRSRVPDPGGETGNNLHIHPALVAAGEFGDPVNAWQGIPQTIECTEFLDFSAGEASRPEGQKANRIWIVPAFAQPGGTATTLPGTGVEHRQWMSKYAHMSVLTAMLHDQTTGTVRPDGELGVKIDYVPTPEDQRELLAGLRACAQLLFASGAKRVLIPSRTPMTLESPADIRKLDALTWTPGLFQPTAVHPMSSVPMGDDPHVAAVDSQGRHHHLRGLWVADGSLLPTSIGGPPQLSIYALGLHVGRALVAAR